jgi:carboxyl-terminal processing protease
MKLRKSAVVVILCLGVVAGALLVTDGVPGKAVRVDRAELLEAVMSHLYTGYIDTTSQEELYGLAIRGMIRRLGDAHAAYITPERYSAMKSRTVEQLAGPGLDLDERDGLVVVVAPFVDSPAWKAGIRAGDRIAMVDGERVYGMSAEEVRQLVQGNAGTVVDLIVERAGVARRLRFTVARERPGNTAVGTALLLTSEVGYLRPDRLTAGSAAALGEAIDGLVDKRILSLVMDLRGNPSGLPEEGVALADLFLPAGSSIASTRGRGDQEVRGYEDRSAARWSDLELIVLVDEGTANASEIATGALQDLDRALVLGRRTFGRGSDQELIALSNGGAVMLTTARWYTPLGRRIEFEPTSVRRLAAGAASEDTLRPEFTTSSGRTVLGGGGIQPDVTVRNSSGAAGVIGDRIAGARAQSQDAQFLVERDAVVRVAISLANQAQGQSDLFAKARVLESADGEDGGMDAGSIR